MKILNTVFPQFYSHKNEKFIIDNSDFVVHLDRRTLTQKQSIVSDIFNIKLDLTKNIFTMESNKLWHKHLDLVSSPFADYLATTCSQVSLKKLV